MTETEPKIETQGTGAMPGRSFLGGIGLAIALLALIAAGMSPWVIEAIEPERKPADEVAVDFAIKIKDRLVAKAKGHEYVPPVEQQSGINIAKWYPPGTIALGLCGVCLGVGGFCRNEDVRIAGASVTVGLAAIIFQYYLLLAAAIIFLVLVGIILSVLGIVLPIP